MEFFDTLRTIIETANPYEKIAKFRDFYQKFQRKTVAFDHDQASFVFEKPSYSTYCRVVDPKDVPRRSRFGTREGRAVLLHAVAHIEYSAIDLALDAAYRYKSMPMEFYEDWLEVADDECRHFEMIDELLRELGFKYGDFPVHQGLFDAGKSSLELIDRMAVVPRYLEANGLDANPYIISKLSKFHDAFVQKMIAALEVILEEEVEHVKKGDRWFRWACERAGIENVEKEYFRRVERLYPGTLHSKKFVNIEARRRAGFSCKEIEALAKEDVDCG